MKYLVCFLLAVCLARPSGSHAQVGYAAYRVVDVLTQNTGSEIWSGVSQETEDGLPYIRYRKGRYMEITMGWSRLIYDGPTYVQETFTVHPRFANEGDTGIGRAEIRETATGNIIDSWPIVFKKEKAEKDEEAVTVTVFLSNGRVMVNKLRYERGKYNLPSLDERILYGNPFSPTEVGRILSHIKIERL